MDEFAEGLSQGSEFGTVILVLPNPCRLLSRELIYTALTRQKDRIVILHQGPRSELRKYSSEDRSETARRLTNLFVDPKPINIEGRFYEENLIHRTAGGEMVRSKSEVLIVDHLTRKEKELGYDYRGDEKALTINGVTKYGGGPNGILIITRDEANGSIDSEKIAKLAAWMTPFAGIEGGQRPAFLIQAEDDDKHGAT